MAIFSILRYGHGKMFRKISCFKVVRPCKSEKNLDRSFIFSQKIFIYEILLLGHRFYCMTLFVLMSIVFYYTATQIDGTRNEKTVNRQRSVQLTNWVVPRTNKIQIGNEMKFCVTNFFLNRRLI
jgi:hypothetical protein